MRYVACALSLVALAACDNAVDSYGFASHDESPTLVCNSSNVMSVNAHGYILQNIYENEFDSILFVKLEMTDECVMSGLDYLHVHKDTIVAIDRKTSTINLFRKDGRFIKRYKRVGSGPGEYSKISNAYLKGDDVFVTDYLSPKTLHYKLDGTLVNERLNGKYAVASVLPVSDSLFLETHWCNGFFTKDNHFELTVSDVQQNVTASARPFVSNLPTHGGDFTIGSDGQSLYYSGFCDTIFCVTPNSIEPYLHLSLWDNADLVSFYEEAFATDSKSYYKYVNLSKRIPINYLFWETNSFWIVTFSDDKRSYRSFIDRETLSSHTYVSHDKESGAFNDVVNVYAVTADDWVLAPLTENSLYSIGEEAFAKAVSGISDEALRKELLSLYDEDCNGGLLMLHIKKR